MPYRTRSVKNIFKIILPTLRIVVLLLINYDTRNAGNVYVKKTGNNLTQHNFVTLVLNIFFVNK